MTLNSLSDYGYDYDGNFIGDEYCEIVVAFNNIFVANLFEHDEIETEGNYLILDTKNNPILRINTSTFELPDLDTIYG